MRLLIIGTLDGQIGGASRIAIDRGAQVAQADDIKSGLEALRAGNGADLVMIDVNLDVGSLIDSLKDERIIIPVVACGIGNDTQAAVRAIKAGAKEYINPINPVSLARLIMPYTDTHSAGYSTMNNRNHTMTEAAL